MLPVNYSTQKEVNTMERFRTLVCNARNYLGQANQSQTEEERNEILAFATAHPEAIDNFFHDAEANQDWTTLVNDGNIAYHIERISHMKISDSEKKAMEPKIQPMVWGDFPGKVAVIKATL